MGSESKHITTTKDIIALLFIYLCLWLEMEASFLIFYTFNILIYFFIKSIPAYCIIQEIKYVIRIYTNKKNVNYKLYKIENTPGKNKFILKD